MTSRSLFFAAALVVGLPACGQSESSASDGDGARAGRPGTGGSAGVGGMGGAGSGGGGAAGASGKSDFDVLSGCASGACAAESSAQLIEAFTQYIDRASLPCVLTALRDRSVGRYAHDTNSSFTNGVVGAEHAVVVLASGAAFYARRRYGSGAGIPSYEPEAGQRCVLKPSSYFDACLAALERPTGPSMDPEAWSCAFGSGTVTTPSTLEWFESCETESPASCP